MSRVIETTPPIVELESADRRRGKSAVTRRLLIEATIEAIANGGLQQTTLDRVSEISGLSRGLVGFHFRTKDKLLVTTLQYLTEEYHRGWQEILSRPGSSPERRIRALIDFDLGPLVCTPTRVAVWFAFWGAVQHRPAYRRYCAPWEEANVVAIGSELERLVQEGGYSSVDAQRIAQGYAALIIGLWQQFNAMPERFDHARAKGICLGYLASVFPRHFREA